MVPALFIHLEKMPLDPSGKVTRRLLPEADFSNIKTETEFIAPRTETELKLAAIVKEILQIDKVGVKDSFFDLGGHSMMATQVVSRIRDAFDVEISLRVLFERPTVEGIALSVTEAQTEDGDDEDIDALLDEIEDLSDEELQKLLDSE
jgi:acyl carrier protein